MGASIRWTTWGAVMVALVAAASAMPEAPMSSPSGCIMALTACEGPIRNSTETPPPTCCVPLKNAVETKKECVCGIINNPTLLSNYKITTDQIYNLAARCNVDATPSLCTAAPTSSPPAASPPTPPIGMSNSSGKNSGSTYDVITWSGIALILAVMAASVF